MHFESVPEGLCLQIMHIGPYRTEPETIARMDLFAGENGYRMLGKHYEIYLGNPVLAAEDKLKTVLRHQIELAR